MGLKEGSYHPFDLTMFLSHLAAPIILRVPPGAPRFRTKMQNNGWCSGTSKHIQLSAIQTILANGGPAPGALPRSNKNPAS
ncbi:MAG: hypothetical protein KGO02_08130, partial [Alphaproteobacteria bacterium]|nr:hypothetical protein [Alphaproteobacteria bacterium]